MGFGPKPTGMIRSVIKQNHVSRTFQRPNFTKSSVGETSDTTTDVSLTVYLFREMENNVQNDFGERLDADMGGLCLASEDIRVNDRVTIGADSYEVASINHLPREGNVKYKFFSLVRRTNNR
ncbi:SPP1 gp16-like head completion protein [Haloarcula tailed virus 2]|uniref:SPP1 gp16-like head completion protein n=1 Tax=Haloarcula tailed virus 2 TaxID=2877989 RepID=A0AAE8XZT5_9CAUD|nr:SPP1 gp16-like head completion protein [Haloarcula tailed virus 2]UBF23167.1 SPP1 gp16-like head completion protein [Haloarcula tailed virus 2]